MKACLKKEKNKILLKLKLDKERAAFGNGSIFTKWNSHNHKFRAKKTLDYSDFKMQHAGLNL